MANYYGTARTNYFRVKDVAAFEAWVEKHHLDVNWDSRPGRQGLVAVFGDGDEGGTFNLLNDAEDDSLDIADEIAAHLADDSIAVIMEAGAEKMRYITGWAVAINSKGERVQISLDDIYDMAATKFNNPNISKAIY